MNIKDIITILAQILNLNKFTKITPEMFRLAKYDDQRAASTFLTLIYDVLLWKTGQKTESLLSPQQKLMLIVILMHRVEYPRIHKLSTGLNGALSSRELLICFGWIVVEFRLIETLQSRAERYICKDLTKGYLDDQMLSEMDELEVNDCELRRDLLGDAHKLLHMDKKVDLC